jgi:hypothetical protein
MGHNESLRRADQSQEPEVEITVIKPNGEKETAEDLAAAVNQVITEEASDDFSDDNPIKIDVRVTTD